MEGLGGLIGRPLKTLGDKVKELREEKGYIEVVVGKGDLVEAARAFKDAGFDHVVSVTAVDYPKEGVIKLSYHTSSYTNKALAGVILALSTYLERTDQPRVQSLTGVWPSSEFMEREVFEFFGVVFEGHPDLRPLLLIPELASKRVLRKDFVVREESIYEGVPF